MTSCSLGMYSSALRISAATCSAGSTTVFAMVDNADADLLVGPDVLEQMQVLPVRARAFEGQYIAVELQQVRQSAFVTRHFPMNALLIRISPAGMHPDLGIHVDEL